MALFLLKQKVAEAFDRYAAEGLRAQPGAELSHVCLKFTSQANYQAGVATASNLGKVTQEIFKGKQITWCKLNDFLQQGDMKLEWLELVEPLTEKHPFDGVANIGYRIADLGEVIKQPSADQAIIFRYQSKHASELAPI